MSIIKKIESLLLHEFKTIPFHNLFMLNNKNILASDLGGTCSDKVLHFKKVLLENGISSKIHSTLIGGIACHRMLSVEVYNQKYFIDVGSGWPSTKLFPAFKSTEYSVYGMAFKTELLNDKLLLFHQTSDKFKPMISIPLEEKSECEILSAIENRFKSNIIYPFQNSLRFSKVINNSFFFIKGNRLRIYTSNSITEKKLSLIDISKLITETFNFDLTGLNFDFSG